MNVRYGLRRRVIAVLLFMACAHNPSPAGTPAATRTFPLPPADIAVYAAVLDTLFPHTIPATQSIVLVDHTSRFAREDFIPAFWAGVVKAAGPDTPSALDLDRRGHFTYTLTGIAADLSRRLGRGVTLISDETVASLRAPFADELASAKDPDAYWHHFRSRFPHGMGITRLSPVGYNHGGEVAILNVDHSCGGLCGEGHIVTLRRIGRTWHVIAIQGTWVS